MTTTEEQRERMEKWATAFDPGRERHEDDHPTINLMRLRADDIRAVLSALSTASARAYVLQAELDGLRTEPWTWATDALFKKIEEIIGEGRDRGASNKAIGSIVVNAVIQALEPRHD